jgi:hypothetical protein
MTLIAPTTITAYHDCLKLLLGFSSGRACKSASRLDVADLNARVIGGFPNHLDRDRSASARTRNARLAAIRFLFAFAALRHPKDAALIHAPSEPSGTASDGPDGVPHCCPFGRRTGVYGHSRTSGHATDLRQRSSSGPLKSSGLAREGAARSQQPPRSLGPRSACAVPPAARAAAQIWPAARPIPQANRQIGRLAPFRTLRAENTLTIDLADRTSGRCRREGA